MIALLLLSACSPSGDAFWMTSAGFNWHGFNHRLSYYDMGMDEQGNAWASVVGGTSTTQQGVAGTLPDECDVNTCREFPFSDDADIALGWTRVTQRGAVFGSAGVSVIADAVGGTTELVIDLPSAAKGEPVVFITGLQIDTNEPLSGGDACYNPEFGWLPTQMGVELGAPALSDDGTQVTVDVTGTFAAGLTLEDERACLDAVVDQAQVAMTVQVTTMVSKREHESIQISNAAVYERGDDQNNPLEQPDPPASERTLGSTLSGDLAGGWSRLDYTFHADETDGRGAYIRSLIFDVIPANDFASGHATNYSPGTQFSGFDYDFEGTVEVVSVSGEVRTGLIEQTLPVELDDDGRPVVFDLQR